MKRFFFFFVALCQMKVIFRAFGSFSMEKYVIYWELIGSSTFSNFIIFLLYFINISDSGLRQFFSASKQKNISIWSLIKMQIPFPIIFNSFFIHKKSDTTIILQMNKKGIKNVICFFLKWNSIWRGLLTTISVKKYYIYIYKEINVSFVLVRATNISFSFHPFLFISSTRFLLYNFLLLCGISTIVCKRYIKNYLKLKIQKKRRKKRTFAFEPYKFSCIL